MPRAHTPVHLPMRAYTHAYVYPYTHLPMHIYIHTYTHRYTHIRCAHTATYVPQKCSICIKVYERSCALFTRHPGTLLFQAGNVCGLHNSIFTGTELLAVHKLLIYAFHELDLQNSLVHECTGSKNYSKPLLLSAEPVHAFHPTRRRDLKPFADGRGGISWSKSQ
jgi:hypothetical protein